MLHDEKEQDWSDLIAACDDCRRTGASGMGRRGFLGAGFAASLMAATAWPILSLAALPTDRRLVVVLLRGAMDGLAAVPPYADPAYKAQRGSLAIAEPGANEGALDLNGFFGLHPSMTNLHGLYKKGELAVFQAVASPYRERSHFDAQNLLEVGTSQPHGARDGWMNRMLGLYGSDGPKLGIAFNQTIPMILTGQVPVASWAPGGNEIPDDFINRLQAVYQHDQLFARTLSQAVMAGEIASEADMAGGGGGRGGAGAIRQTISTAAKMLTVPNGQRMAVIEIGGWDTHANQGAANGALANRLQQLDEGLGILAEEMAPVWKDTAVVVMTEFGRTVAVNGTRGTDHGTAGAAFLLGGAVNGGYVLTKWPGLDKAQLYEGRDLAPTLDIRSLLKSVLSQHLELPVADIERLVFPGSGGAGAIRQLIRA
jgi:uncharacterized protein (DUF1501 family)